jgi:hypothetical protein
LTPNEDRKLTWHVRRVMGIPWNAAINKVDAAIKLERERALTTGTGISLENTAVTLGIDLPEHLKTRNHGS